MGEMKMARKRSLAHLVPNRPALIAKSIRVSIGDETRVSRRVVQALVMGNWALHRLVGGDHTDRDDSDAYCVTYVPTGCSLNVYCGGIPLWDAVDVVAALATHVADLMVAPDGLTITSEPRLLVAIVAEIIGESNR